jgi:hypothetical protein
MTLRIKGILSNRFHKKGTSWNLVQEWEDDFAAHFKIPIQSGKFNRKIHERAILNRFSKRIFGRIPGMLHQYLDSLALFGPAGDKFLIFAMNPAPSYYGYRSTRRDAIPVIIDFWKQTDLPAFYRTYRNCELVLISSLEVYNYLKGNACPLNIVHFPLSLSDCHKTVEVPKKLYDILLPARYNPVLTTYMLEFESNYPDVEWVIRTTVDHTMQYKSNKRGLLGSFYKRSDYLKLISESKIAFYATPGMDGGSERTGGFNPVTPRFLELLNARCLMLGRYPKNEETDFYEVEKVCPRVETYEEFEKVLLQHLNTSNANWDTCSSILNKHWTSRRLALLEEILKR